MECDLVECWKQQCGGCRQETQGALSPLNSFLLKLWHVPKEETNNQETHEYRAVHLSPDTRCGCGNRSRNLAQMPLGGRQPCQQQLLEFVLSCPLWFLKLRRKRMYGKIKLKDKTQEVSNKVNEIYCLHWTNLMDSCSICPGTRANFSGVTWQ